ncbi:MAG: allantoinase PuuE [Pseudomonadota bacterium]
MPYPRDLLGHGPTPPDPAWPGGARLALQVVLNFEEGGERCLLHGDGESEAFLSEMPGATPLHGQRHWNMETVYDYGARVGFWRLHRILTERDVPVTVFAVTSAIARAPAQVAAMQDAGWEIACHGMRWIDYGGHGREAEKAEMLEAVRLHTAVTGAPPRGWYTGRCSVSTVDLVAEIGAEIGAFAYAADSYADELPYWHPTPAGPQLVVPYTLDANDMRFSISPGFNEPAEFEAYLRGTFDRLWQEGGEGRPAIMNVGLHCRLAGRPGRAAALARFLDHVAAHEGVWMATRLEIAEHWARLHPPPAGGPRPSTMERDAFLAAYGGVFEHSPWIAEEAWDFGIGPAMDTAEGLHAALRTRFRLADPARRRAVLNAHPDLAGKLAAARQLTPESAAEQAGAGLDALTEAERERFTALNTAYRDRFAHPFIMAVKGRSKADILAAFEARLGNDAAAEFDTACREVEKIARLRLEEMLGR